MIEYDFGKWGVGIVLKMRGSVFPKAMVWATPSFLMVIFTKLLIRFAEDQGDNVPVFRLIFIGDLMGITTHASTFTSLWAGYTMVLGFCLVFRTQIAYSRFWEGCTLLNSVRGVWFNATSNLVAFSSDEPTKKRDVLIFQHLLVRLMSMMFCAALQQVAVMEEEDFEILGEHGISLANLDYLAKSKDKTEVLMQWIQKLIVRNMYDEVLPIPAPIISRVFQELSNGIVDITNARKICEFPFPFPYAQMITFFLLLHLMITPIASSLLINSYIMAGLLAFITVFAFWSVNYIAAEIEMPFGDDDNDLPVGEIQIHFNRSLRMLMDPMAQQPPEFRYDEREHRLLMPVRTTVCVGAGEDDMIWRSQVSAMPPIQEDEEEGMYHSMIASPQGSPRSTPKEKSARQFTNRSDQSDTRSVTSDPSTYIVSSTTAGALVGAGSIRMPTEGEISMQCVTLDVNAPTRSPWTPSTAADVVGRSDVWTPSSSADLLSRSEIKYADGSNGHEAYLGAGEIVCPMRNDIRFVDSSNLYEGYLGNGEIILPDSSAPIFGIGLQANDLLPPTWPNTATNLFRDRPGYHDESPVECIPKSDEFGEPCIRL